MDVPFGGWDVRIEQHGHQGEQGHIHQAHDQDSALDRVELRGIIAICVVIGVACERILTTEVLGITDVWVYQCTYCTNTKIGI